MRDVMGGRLAKLLYVVILGNQLCACASLSDQPRNEVRVNVGPEPVRAYRAEPYASLYLSYAMMSSLAYAGHQSLDPDFCPEFASLDRKKDAETISWMRSLKAKKWQCLFGLSETLPCPRRYPSCHQVGVPDLQVWRRSDPFCAELAIVFRGVDLMNPADWPYLRWLVPRFDQYDQIQTLVDRVAINSGCRRASTRVVAVGHSLGGGLAEAAAYANGRIRYVYGFNAFPVAGFIGPKPATWSRNKIGLGIDNVYESGEILAFPRLLVMGPGTSCNPRTRTVQFNLIPFGLPVEKHQIKTLAANMVELSRHGSNAQPAMAYHNVPSCSETLGNASH
jgi:hypothetical protein